MQQFSDNCYRLFSTYLAENYGINYPPMKKDILKMKIQKLMRVNEMESCEDYFRLISGGESSRHLTQFLDEVSTHTTNFFREASHFNYIQGEMRFIMEKNPRIQENKEIRVWSAACSSGEEAYTLGIVLKESIPANISIKILATDMSKKVLITAIRGQYSRDIEKDMIKHYLNRYFVRTKTDYRVRDELKEMITFRQFNLMDPFEFKKGFDIIFCRNVMIYFDKPLQYKLVDKFYNALVPGGLFFLGHSEGLTHRDHKFRYLQPALYIK